MKKIALILNSSLYVRNYVDTGLIDVLKEYFQVSIILRSGVELPLNVRDIPVFNYSIEKKVEKKLSYLLHIAMFRYRNRSSSIRLRIERGSIKNQILNVIHSRSIKNFLGNGLRLPKIIINRIIIAVSALFITDKRYDFYLKKLPISKSLELAIMEANPDLILLPSSAFGVEDGIIPKIGRNLQVKTFFLIDNWDNLSSKSVILDCPDLMGVWGQQSKMHAIKIQGVPEKRVVLLGTPRFDSYFSLRNIPLAPIFPFPYVLFVGTALPFNEAKVLKIIDEEISANKSIYGELKVVYRPHPWRQGIDSIEDLELQNIVVDPQVSENYFKKRSCVTFQPAIDYYPSLISDSIFVMGGLTSMLVEALIFYKKFVGLTHHEKDNPVSPDRVFKEYVHFKEIEEIDMVELCHNLKELPSIFRVNYLKNHHSSNLTTSQKNKIDLERNYFLFNDNYSYQKRLIDSIETLITN